MKSSSIYLIAYTFRSSALFEFTVLYKKDFIGSFQRSGLYNSNNVGSSRLVVCSINLTIRRPRSQKSCCLLPKIGTLRNIAFPIPAVVKVNRASNLLWKTLTQPDIIIIREYYRVRVYKSVDDLEVVVNVFYTI